MQGSDAGQTLPGRMVGTLELGSPSGRPGEPLNTLVGEALDARLFTDLAALAPDRLLVPNDRFFVRTACPVAAKAVGRWTIHLGGLVKREREVTVDALEPLVKPFGACLIECAGNNNPANFGLISAADWEGVPLAGVIDMVERRPSGARMLVSGMDDLSQRSRT